MEIRPSELIGSTMTVYYDRGRRDWDTQIELAFARHGITDRREVYVYCKPWPPLKRDGKHEKP